MARSDRGERRHRRHRREHVRESHSESDSTDDEDSGGDKVKAIETPRDKKRTSHNYDDAMMSGGLGDGAPAGPVSSAGMGNLREDPNVPGQYIGYVRNPPPPASLGVNVGRRND